MHTWLLAAAPIDRFLGPKDTHALKPENKFSQHSDCSSCHELLFCSFNNKSLLYLLLRYVCAFQICIFKAFPRLSGRSRDSSMYSTKDQTVLTAEIWPPPFMSSFTRNNFPMCKLLLSLWNTPIFTTDMSKTSDCVQAVPKLFLSQWFQQSHAAFATVSTLTSKLAHGCQLQ